MKIIKALALAIILLSVSFLNFVSLGRSKAESSWQPEAIASSNLVRFEVQTTVYDATPININIDLLG